MRSGIPWLLSMVALVSGSCSQTESPSSPPPPKTAPSPASTPAPADPSTTPSDPSDPSDRPGSGEPTDPATQPVSLGPALTFVAPQKPTVCSYTLEEVRTETIGGQATAGHKIDVQLSAEVSPAPKAANGFSVKLTAEHVTAEAKLGGYRIKLDSARAADQRRVAGGADTLLFFDVIAYFALLGDSVRANVSEQGAVVGSLEGGKEARDRFLKLHPERPRKDPRQRALVEQTLSDDGILERLWPIGPKLPAEGIRVGQTLDAVPTYRGYDDFAGAGQSIRRLLKAGAKTLFEQKAALAPPEALPKVDPAKVPKIPAREGMPHRKLLGADRSLLVELMPPDPCFGRAASREELRVAYKGQMDEKEVDAEQVVRTVRIFKRVP